MKLRNIAILTSAAALMLSAAGCGSGGDEENVVFSKNLILSEEYVEMDPAGSVTVDITDGNGGYTLTPTRPEIATASLADGKVTVTGVSSGQANIIVTDKDGVNGLISVLVFGDIQLEAEEITVNAGERALDLPATAAVIKVTFGNGNYTVTSDSDVEFVVDGRDIEVKAYEFGELTATVKDRTGRTKDFKIIANDRYASFKNSSADIYSYTQQGIYFGDFGTASDVVVDGYYRFRKAYLTYMDFHLNIPVTQTLNAGKKQGCTFYFYNAYSPAGNLGSAAVPIPVEVFVIKNDGARVWIGFFNDKISGTVCRPVIATP